MKAARLRGRDGFSLVEVLVAVAVAGLVMTAGAGLSQMVSGVESRQTRANAARESVIAVDRLLRSIVDGAVPDVRHSGDRVHDVSQATFLTSGPPVLAFDRPTRMTIAIERGDQRAGLLVRWRDPETGRERQETVLSGARALTLSYFRAAEGSIPGAWIAGWADPLKVPIGVLLRVDVPELGPPIDLIARNYSRFPNVCALLPHEPKCSDVATASEMVR